MPKHGAIFVYGAGDPITNYGHDYIIDKEDYKVKVTKRWVPSVDVWHIKFQSQSVFDTYYELFLSKEELETLINSLNAIK